MSVWVWQRAVFALLRMPVLSKKLLESPVFDSITLEFTLVVSATICK